MMRLNNLSMGPAPGPHAIFYKSQWDTVGPAVCRFVKEVLMGNSSVESINRTFLVLIPKVEKPESLNQMRPISLCNVSYKIITKIIANRLKVLLPKLIAPTQCSFIPGRHITDNVVIAQEIIHTMRSKKGNKGYMAIKVDLEKAYDRLNWNFVRETLKETGIPDHLVDIIMQCISSCSMQVLWNGEATDAFSPTRGGEPRFFLISFHFFPMHGEPYRIQSSRSELEAWAEMAPKSPISFLQMTLCFLRKPRWIKSKLSMSVLTDFASAQGRRLAKPRLKFIAQKCL